jgi:hypothetical protein
LEKHSTRVTIVHPIPGKNAHYLYWHLGSQFFYKTIDVQIDKLDTPLDQDWYDLVAPIQQPNKLGYLMVLEDDKLWWFMSPQTILMARGTLRWNAGGTYCPPPDVAGKMKFDLNGATNYNHYEKQTCTN